MSRNKPDTQDLHWLQGRLDALPQVELPPSLSAEALFARLDQLEAQEPAPGDGAVLTPDFGPASRRKAWQRVASAAAVFLVVAVAVYQQGLLEAPLGKMSGAARSMETQQESSAGIAMDAAPFAMPSAPQPEGMENPSTGGGGDVEAPAALPPSINPATGGGAAEDQLDGGGMLQGLARTTLSPQELYRQADLVVTATLPDLASQDLVTVRVGQVLKGKAEGEVVLTLLDKTSLDPEREYVLFLVWQGDGYGLLQEPPLLYLSPRAAIQDSEGRQYGTVLEPAF